MDIEAFMNLNSRQSKAFVLSNDKLYIQGLALLISDIVAIVMAYQIARLVRFGSLFINENGIAWKNVLVLILVYIIIYSLKNRDINLLSRGIFHEFTLTVRDMSLEFLGVLTLMFVMQITAYFSRSVIIYSWMFGIVLMCSMRQILKFVLKNHYFNQTNSEHIIIITTRELAKSTIDNIKQNPELIGYHISGLVLLDSHMKLPDHVYGVPVIASESTMYPELTVAHADEVLINLPPEFNDKISDMIKTIESMGAVVNFNLQLPGIDLEQKTGTLRHFGDYNTISFAKNRMGLRMLFIKRATDIVLSFFGLLLSSVIILLVTPFILIESPGPLFFSQVRIGKNGRRFKIYKLRSMYMDAEERKKELMAHNEMDGLMFKIEDDPRITKVGRFIRKTSIDELPQFLNVFTGSMSLIGTRPPTVDEYEQYEANYKRRLSIKPGITGLWQVSGRSDIIHFDEVLKLDLAYIDHWSLVYDLKIILKTFQVVLFSKGAK